MFDLYQVPLTEAESNLINTLGWDKACEQCDNVKAYVMSTRTKDYEGAWETGAYVKVAIIDATDLENSFEIGNIGPDENIERLDRMRSMSVGDIVIDSNGVLHACAPMGFKTLNGMAPKEEIIEPFDAEKSDMDVLLHIAETEAFNASELYFNDTLGGVDQYPCGFAEVIILELHGKKITGNTRLGKKFKRHGIEQNYHRKFSVWHPGNFNCQNMDTLIAGARAYAKVFNDRGFKAYVDSRMD